MQRLIALLTGLPLGAGCVTVNRYSLFDATGTGLAATDASITSAVLLIAACSGAIGGIVVWLGVRSWRRSASS